MTTPLVGLVMGSDSDWETMQHAATLLGEFGVPFEQQVVSAHRTPDLLASYAREARGRGLACIIAGAGGAAHLPGMLAAHTSVPVLGVPVQSRALQGLDSLLSIAQMPAGVPVATFAIGEAGAKNAALFAVSLLARADDALRRKLDDFRARQTAKVLGTTLPPFQVILPGATLGMLGGGQLGRMFVMAAREMGYKILVLDPDPDSPAGRIADLHLQRPFDDPGVVERIIGQCSAVTTEFENVPASVLELLAVRLPVRPGARAVAIAQDRITEKLFLQSHDLPTAPFRAIRSAQDIPTATAEIPGPWILKTSRLGYDGKGQARLTKRPDALTSFVELGQVPCILERLVPLDLELSVVMARGEDGRTALFPPGENVHRQGILETTTVPARVAPELAREAVWLASTVAEALEYVGVLAVELFVSEGKLLVNEIAPRPHNSGHWTQNAASASQFEQQVRTLCGLPLAETKLLSPVTMINVLGDVWSRGEPDWDAALSDSGVHLHLYGKAQPRPGRKMGHMNVLGTDPGETVIRAHRALKALARMSR